MKKAGVLLCILIVMICFFVTCVSKEVSEGHDLAEKHCQSCHQFPTPELLDKKTWANYVLPKMGNLLGFRHFGSGTYFEEGKIQGIMPLADWNRIVYYYIHNAPDSLAQHKHKQQIQIGLKDFEITIPAFSVKSAATTCVGFLPDQHQLFFADGISQHGYLLSIKGNLIDSFMMAEGVVNIQRDSVGMKSLAMGVLYPSDEKKGSLIEQNFTTKKSEIIIDSLQRPVYAEYVDLNSDHLEDIIICEFGNVTGQLAWYENKGNNKYSKHILRPFPGAIRTQVFDANKDGRPDIMALMAQGDEGIFIFYNKGNGVFEEKQVLRFSPSFGSNYFELADFNGDGFEDILATDGDNGDYPPIMKPYHGIRIYLNDGQNNFKERKFLPMNGASKAMAKDFDGDGDLDIASISYFPDYSNTPEESFIYWENKGNFSFQPFSFKGAFAGRWLTMDAGDMDGDGDLDIILGAAKFPIGAVPGWLMKKWNASSPSILVLKNKRKE
jgi:hypothetical protein